MCCVRVFSFACWFNRGDSGFFPGPNDVLVAEKIVEAVEKERFSSLSLLRTALPSVLIKKVSMCLRSS